ncbi:hypothetical protein BaRGS_00021316, partial [Batillaria attramentaria]
AVDCSDPPTPTDMTFSHNGTSLAVDCQTPPAMENAAVVYSDTTYLNTAVYTCNEGYLANVPNTTMTCSDGGTWTGDVINCLAIDCGAPPDIGNSFYNHSGVSTGYLSEAVYQCHSGHQYINSLLTLTCRAVDGVATWDGPTSEKDLSCTKMNPYVGCYPVSATVEGNYGKYACRTVCREKNLKYAALRGNECACLDTIAAVAVGDENCNMPSSDDDSLYGGEPDLWSIFGSFRKSRKLACKPTTQTPTRPPTHLVKKL